MRALTLGCRKVHPARILVGVAAVAIILISAPAFGKASHAGWPAIHGILKMHKSDRDGTIRGTRRSDELLGGHGNDVILGGDGRDVIWGDYKPCCQPTHQHDRLYGGASRDFIYSSHGFNTIDAGPGNDVVHAHFGRGIVDCGSGYDVVDVSHHSRRLYRIRHCERIK